MIKLSAKRINNTLINKVLLQLNNNKITKANFTQNLKTLLPRDKRKTVLEELDYLNLNQYGKYPLIVPTKLSLGVESINIDEIIPKNIAKPPYAYSKQPKEWSKVIGIKDEELIEKMRKACKLAKKMLHLGGSMCKEGVTTLEIDDALRKAILENNAYPSTLNYMGFPKSICTSINNVICHGIPDSRPLKNGDIINIDVTVYLNGVHGDTSATFMVGDVDDAGKKLVSVTKKAMEKAISICGPGVEFKKIGKVISEIVKDNGFSVSDELTGHGIGAHFHELPLIFHHENQEEGIMQSGMTFTIEPIVSQGSPIGKMWPDGWTIVTEDGSRSAQFEHTVLITNDGVEILTE
ncbi:methionine aminopeptidase [Neoconidiobolus thromboides FSU 785]|nr:methionine aminopeptidase [Neoconidiobolus thromboides FSU 785]